MCGVCASARCAMQKGPAALGTLCLNPTRGNARGCLVIHRGPGALPHPPALMWDLGMWGDLEPHRNTTHRQSAHNLPLANTRGGSCSHKKPPAGLLLWKKAACDLRPSAVGFRLVFILGCCFFKTAAYLSQTGTCRCIAKAPEDGRVGPVENRRCKAHIATHDWFERSKQTL